MPVLARPDAEIYYEVYGSGYPLLIFAPGARSSRSGGTVRATPMLRRLG